MRSNGPKRYLTFMCAGCGWTVNLPCHDGRVEIGAVEGWDVTPSKAVLCERCVTGWRPTSPTQAAPPPLPAGRMKVTTWADSAEGSL